MASKKFLFMVDKLPYKAESSRLALTHAIASQTVDIHLDEDDEMEEPVIAFVGDGVLNCMKGQKALECYGVTSLEMHIKNALLTDIKVLICKEDVERLGLSEDNLIMDAEDIGADMQSEIVPFDDILQQMEKSNHILYF
ncbi:MAG: DsrE family protein [Candidatus Magnetoovum sp. WYHC-5]|nr:DsrE family protein [Candidatus Magnetoovum sp. WYHC-5]